MIIDAFHDRSVKNPDPEEARRQAYERTMKFFAGYLAAGGCADHFVIQTWHPYGVRQSICRPTNDARFR